MKKILFSQLIFGILTIGVLSENKAVADCYEHYDPHSCSQVAGCQWIVGGPSYCYGNSYSCNLATTPEECNSRPKRRGCHWFEDHGYCGPSN